LPSFAAWLQDISDEGDGNSLTSLAMELKKIMKGVWLFIDHYYFIPPHTFHYFLQFHS